MFEVRMPREIKSYKEKIWMGLTARQLICVGLAIVICVPTFLIGRNYLSDDMMGYIIFGIAGIFAFFGWYQKNGLTAEQYVITIYKYTFVDPKRRVFATKTKLHTVLDEEYTEKTIELSELSQK